MLNKITLSQLRAGMQTFLDFPGVEKRMQKDIEGIVAQIELSQAQNGGRPPVDVLVDYLADPKNSKERFKFIVGISGGSMERMRRVFSTMFPGVAWGEMKRDATIIRRVAEFLVNPNGEEVFIPVFIKNAFALPENWIDLLRDKNYLNAVAHNLSQSKYAVRMGLGLEDAACKIVAGCGFEYMKGAVEIVDNKEVDIAIPNVSNPRILIMSSYQLTTASAQSSKANEQARMYQNVQTYNRSRRGRRQPEILFINIIDGGGWLARPNDLETMWHECDFCFSHAGLGGLKKLLQSI